MAVTDEADGVCGQSILDIVKECDNFPYHNTSNPEPLETRMASTWQFFIPDDPKPYGYLTSSTVDKMPWTPDFEIISGPVKQVRLSPKSGASTPEACQVAMASLISLARETGLFPELGKRGRELYSVLGAPYPFKFDRKAHALFGLVTRGVHMTVYTHNVDGEMRIWVPQRSLDRPVYTGLFDNSVAGGVGADEAVLDALVRESAEEAGLDEGFVRRAARACGALTWFNIKDSRSGSRGMLHPGIQYVYDLEVEADVVLKPVDGEVEKFNLWDVETVRKTMAQKKFKPSSALVLLDFFIRHGMIAPEEEADYVEVVSRLHRRLPFPVGA
ncbi:putative thiamin pyrophosphokinase [Coniochaeta ligniaria NRRL 30616]|uniref:Putative thiamin pyrophosphokinase n=1 Tax=Coniochaeta ligniaria NRRL 30616 TaxID=1408157 RepID=A0A1J7JQL8_9PEZI|nr:putative thiamin pyrophosphokinase [Coniochaeta ligniaria NRRL 30616]